MLECKSVTLNYNNITFTELIDTCWNVNDAAVNETWDLTGINRYMLECK